jgi:hypothetical protein
MYAGRIVAISISVRFKSKGAFSGRYRLQPSSRTCRAFETSPRRLQLRLFCSSFALRHQPTQQTSIFGNRPEYEVSCAEQIRSQADPAARLR